jgi:hypothetical protein
MNADNFLNRVTIKTPCPPAGHGGCRVAPSATATGPAALAAGPGRFKSGAGWDWSVPILQGSTLVGA